MKSTLTTLLLCTGIILMLAAFGCTANTSDPMTPAANQGLDGSRVSSSDGHGVLGVYDLMFDPESMDLEVTESRGADTHFKITHYIAPYVAPSMVSWDPATCILSFNLSITNPTVVDVFDVRTLFLADASSGYSLGNPDDFTQLFNPFGPDDVNPFRAYAKTTPDRIFAAGTTHEEYFEVLCPPAFGGSARFLIECSWPGNCQEAYEISSQAISNPISTTVPGTITLDAFDHQDNIDGVSIDTTPITGGLTPLVKGAGALWEAEIFNAGGAVPGVYRCWIAAENLAEPFDLYDFIDIVVVPVVVIPKWHTTDYPIDAGACSYDLGVIADPGGPRDSEILMVDSDTTICDIITKYDPYYAGNADYVGLKDYDVANTNYQPYPVLRIDAADDGAFSFTNGNSIDRYPDSASDMFNDQVWSVFDNLPLLHTGPVPDEGRYYFDLLMHDATARPEDVCDDFALGQYALFSSGVCWTPRDLIFIGTMPNHYTHDQVEYVGNLDGWAGVGDGVVNPERILGIDVIEYDAISPGQDYVVLYILEEAFGEYQVEVFEVFDTSPAWIEDVVNHLMTIDISIPGTFVGEVYGHDIETLPTNPLYMPNAIHPNLAVLVSYNIGATVHGEVVMYDAVTGGQLESIGDVVNPAMPDSTVYFLDTDDDDWEIHVTREDDTGNMVATVFDYN